MSGTDLVDRLAAHTRALQDEKMVSLGKLAAGLAHELNNPASATKRGADVLLQELSQLDGALRALSARGLTDEQVLPLFLTRSDGSVRLPIERADRQANAADAHGRHGLCIRTRRAAWRAADS